MVKILVGKSDSLADVIGRLKSTEDSRVILMIPKGTALKTPAENFDFLKRGAAEAGKEIFIESVDEEVLAIAKAKKIDALHPLFSQDMRQQSFSDIVPKGKKVLQKDTESPVLEPREEPREKKKKITSPLPRTEERPVIEEVDDVEEPVVQSYAEQKRSPLMSFSPPRISFAIKRPKIPTWALIGAGILVLMLLGGWGVSRLFGRIQISVVMKQSPWDYENAFLADKTVRAVDADTRTLPGEVFTQSKNITQLFPASGKANVSEKAKGEIVIYNAYSSAPQSLVATTRFATPDGKIFRIAKGVTVPGAEVKDGKIIPSSIETEIIADKAGTEYNLVSAEKLTIPGFEGTPKYEGFYGSIKIPTTGGFSGERAVPTEQDIASAKQKAMDVLTTALKSNVLSGLPEDFKFIEGTSEITFPKNTVNKATDEKGQFSVFAEAQLRAIGFRETDLIGFLNGKLGEDQPGNVFRSLELAYSKISPDLSKGQLRFTLHAEGMAAKAFDEKAFVGEVVGKYVRDVRALVARIPGLESANVSIWPSWLKKSPRSASKVSITVQ